MNVYLSKIVIDMLCPPLDLNGHITRVTYPTTNCLRDPALNDIEPKTELYDNDPETCILIWANEGDDPQTRIWVRLGAIVTLTGFMVNITHNSGTSHDINQIYI